MRLLSLKTVWVVTLVLILHDGIREVYRRYVGKRVWLCVKSPDTNLTEVNTYHLSGSDEHLTKLLFNIEQIFVCDVTSILLLTSFPSIGFLMVSVSGTSVNVLVLTIRTLGDIKW